MALPIAYVAVAGIISLVGYLFVNGKPKKIFVSYYSKGDSHYKNLILAWAKNNNLKLNVEDVSTDTRINSDNKAYLKRRMKERISKADYFIVFVGKDTHKREWVVWEIEQAKALNKRIIAVKNKKSYKSPKPLLNSGVIWVFGFSEKGIRDAINS